jgi:hypothetical protein
LRRVLAVLIVGLAAWSVRSAHAQTVHGVATYTAGWNMVAAGLIGSPDNGFIATGPLLFYSDGQYKPMNVPAMLSGTAGAWAYLPTNETVTIHAPAYTYEVQAPVLPGWNLVGDPYDVPATIPPTTTAYWWDGQRGRYQQATAIPIVAAVWIYADAPGQVPLQAGIPGA